MSCTRVERLLAGYLDEAIPPIERAFVREHLGACASCRQQLEGYRRLAVCLANVRPAEAPADLALRIREKAATSRARVSWPLRMWRRAMLVSQNIVEPMALPAAGGILTAMVAFLFAVQGILMGVPRGVIADDLPTSLMQPARLESLAPFPMTGITAGPEDDGVLILEATINEQGQVVSYNIIAGPNNLALRRQLDQMLLFSRFSPQLSFGRPTPGGHVVLNWVLVRG
jgi:Putative zinc-finger